MKHFQTIILLILLLAPSCAYMQTHKNVAEIGSHYVGAEISTNSLQLYSRAGEWYLAAPKVLLKRHYPIIHDTVYRDHDNVPTESVIESHFGTSKLYMPISSGTAMVLQRTDGYAELESLIQESRDMGRPALEHLPSGKRHAICAHVEKKGRNNTFFILHRNPEKNDPSVTFLSKLDKYTVDLLGTVAYNVAIPLMAPFRFFGEFLSND